MFQHRTQTGLTLIELITSIVILSVATFGILVALSGVIGRSADPMIQQQASAIAQSYLAEVSLKRFCDADFSTDCVAACLVSACTGGGACGGAGVGPVETRASFDDVCDYAGLTDVGARDQTDTSLFGLENYTVNVQIQDTGVLLETLDSNAGQVLLINVSVSHPDTQTSVRLSNYKANF